MQDLDRETLPGAYHTVKHHPCLSSTLSHVVNYSKGFRCRICCSSVCAGTLLSSPPPSLCLPLSNSSSAQRFCLQPPHLLLKSQSSVSSSIGHIFLRFATHGLPRARSLAPPCCFHNLIIVSLCLASWRRPPQIGYTLRL